MKRSTPSAVCTACGGDANPAELKLKIESVDRKLKVATVIDLSQSDESEDQDLLPLEWVQGVVEPSPHAKAFTWKPPLMTCDECGVAAHTTCVFGPNLPSYNAAFVDRSLLRVDRDTGRVLRWCCFRCAHAIKQNTAVAATESSARAAAEEAAAGAVSGGAKREAANNSKLVTTTTTTSHNNDNNLRYTPSPPTLGASRASSQCKICNRGPRDLLMHPLHRRDLRVRLRMRTVADVGDDERRWVHTACVLSLRPLYCWFVDKSARHKASPYEAVMGVAATHADDDDDDDDDDEEEAGGGKNDGDGGGGNARKPPSLRSAKYGIDWEERANLTCEICARPGSTAPAQCAVANCFTAIHGSCAMRKGTYFDASGDRSLGSRSVSSKSALMLCKRHTRVEMHAQMRRLLRSKFNENEKKRLQSERSSSSSSSSWPSSSSDATAEKKRQAASFLEECRSKTAIGLVWGLHRPKGWELSAEYAQDPVKLRAAGGIREKALAKAPPPSSLKRGASGDGGSSGVVENSSSEDHCGNVPDLPAGALDELLELMAKQAGADADEDSDSSDDDDGEKKKTPSGAGASSGKSCKSSTRELTDKTRERFVAYKVNFKHRGSVLVDKKTAGASSDNQKGETLGRFECIREDLKPMRGCLVVLVADALQETMFRNRGKEQKRRVAGLVKLLHTLVKDVPPQLAWLAELEKCAREAESYSSMRAVKDMARELRQMAEQIKEWGQVVPTGVDGASGMAAMVPTLMRRASSLDDVDDDAATKGGGATGDTIGGGGSGGDDGDDNDDSGEWDEDGALPPFRGGRLPSAAKQPSSSFSTSSSSSSSSSLLSLSANPMLLDPSCRYSRSDRVKILHRDRLNGVVWFSGAVKRQLPSGGLRVRFDDGSETTIDPADIDERLRPEGFDFGSVEGKNNHNNSSSNDNDDDEEEEDDDDQQTAAAAAVGAKRKEDDAGAEDGASDGKAARQLREENQQLRKENTLLRNRLEAAEQELLLLRPLRSSSSFKEDAAMRNVDDSGSGDQLGEVEGENPTSKKRKQEEMASGHSSHDEGEISMEMSLSSPSDPSAPEPADAPCSSSNSGSGTIGSSGSGGGGGGDDDDDEHYPGWERRVVMDHPLKRHGRPADVARRALGRGCHPKF